MKRVFQVLALTTALLASSAIADNHESTAGTEATEPAANSEVQPVDSQAQGGQTEGTQPAEGEQTGQQDGGEV